MHPLNNPIRLICLHYYAGSNKEWEPLKKLLAPHHAFYAPDLGGFGDASPPAGGYSIAAYADEVAAYIKRLSLSDYLLIGHSMGGKIAAAVAARHPQGLRGLVLLSPSPPPGEPISEEDREKLLKEYGNRQAAEETFRRITANSLPNHVKALVIADNLRSNKEAYSAWLIEGSKEDIAAATKTIRIPVLVIAGTADEAINADTHRQLTLPSLPNNTNVKWIEGCGHLLPLEAPAEVAKAMGEWMAGLSLT